MDMKEASAMTEASGLTNEQDASCRQGNLAVPHRDRAAVGGPFEQRETSLLMYRYSAPGFFPLQHLRKPERWSSGKSSD
jgi:hypothetical protein